MKDIVKRIVKGVSSLYRMERINVSQQDMKDRHSIHQRFLVLQNKVGFSKATVMAQEEFVLSVLKDWNKND